MCEKCIGLINIFRCAKNNPRESYSISVKLIQELIESNALELIAGDCKVGEIEYYIINEEHYTIRHYFKCTKCEQYFFMGMCIRGLPCFDLKKDFSDTNFHSALWGRCGSFF